MINKKETKIKTKNNNRKSVQVSCTHTEEKALALTGKIYHTYPAVGAGFPVVS